MRHSHGAVRLGLLFMATACSGAEPVLGPDGATGTVQMAAADGDRIRLTGAGHHTRTVAGETELTTFSFNAVQHADGKTTGRYQYDFRAAGFAIHGSVTCVTTNGNQAWVGGVVDQVITDDPALEAQLLGVDMWWRSKDLGESAGAFPDSTTGLGFKFAGVAITAASWCADQPVALVIRAVENGNIQLAAD